MKASARNYFSIEELTKVLDSSPGFGDRLNEGTAPRNNAILYHSGPSKELEFLSVCIATLYPCRLFLLSSSCIDGGEQQGEVYFLSAADSPSGDAESVGTVTEIIDLSKGGAHSTEQLVSLIRGCLRGGGETHFFVVDRSPLREVVLPLLRMSSTLFCDSLSFTSFRSLLDQGRIDLGRTVDLGWLRLSSARERIRNSFEGLDDFSSLKEIQINISEKTYFSESSRSIITLLLGWIIDRLHLEVMSMGALGFECRVRGTRKAVSMKVLTQRTQQDDSVSCTFHLETTSRSADFFLREEALTQKSRIFAPSDVKDIKGILLEWALSLERYFLIGEAFTNYPSARSNAYTLEDLQKAY